MENIQIIKPLRLKDDMALRDTVIVMYESWCAMARRYATLRRQPVKERTAHYDLHVEALAEACDRLWEQLATQALAPLINRALRHKHWKYVLEARVGRRPTSLMLPLSIAPPDARGDGVIQIFIYQGIRANDQVTKLQLTWPLEGGIRIKA